MKIITLIGFMGCGKTTIGKHLAEVTKTAFFDLDEVIVQRQGCSIEQIFLERGEKFFRDIESQVLEECLSNMYSGVLSTGGGVVIREVNRNLLKIFSTPVFLNAPFEVLYSRITKDSTNRPLAKMTKDKLFDLFKARLPLYLETAVHTVDASLTIKTVRDNILSLIFKDR